MYREIQLCPFQQIEEEEEEKRGNGVERTKQENRMAPVNTDGTSLLFFFYRAT